MLVDGDDRDRGIVEKLEAHQPPGALHRAISVFLFDNADRLLLQQRAREKHHFRGLWSNTCCTHPRPGEDVVSAGRRRLEEEMGCDAPLEVAGTFEYFAADPHSDLVERELDHVLVGTFNGTPEVDPAEVQAWMWLDVAEVRSDIAHRPERYTPWLAEALDLATGGRRIRA